MMRRALTLCLALFGALASAQDPNPSITASLIGRQLITRPTAALMRGVLGMGSADYTNTVKTVVSNTVNNFAWLSAIVTNGITTNVNVLVAGPGGFQTNTIQFDHGVLAGITEGGSSISPLLAGELGIDCTRSPWLVDPTGVNDSTAGLQGAIDFACYSNAPTRKVVMPVGHIKITGTILLPITSYDNNWPATNRLELCGYGQNATILECATLTNKDLFLCEGTNSQKYTDILLRDFHCQGPGVTTNADGSFWIGTLSSNYTSAGLRMSGNTTFSQIAHNNQLLRVDFWGFGDNLVVTNTTEFRAEHCRFFAGSHTDALLHKNDNMEFDSCSFGWQGYATAGVLASIAPSFLASIVVIGQADSGGRGVSFPNCEIYYALRHGWFDRAIVSFPFGYNLEGNAYPGQKEYFILTNACTIQFGNGSFNNFHGGGGSTTNQAVFRGYAGGLAGLLIEGANFNVQNARWFATDDEKSSPTLVGVVTKKTDIPNIAYEFAGHQTNWLYVGHKWSADFDLKSPATSYGGYEIPAPGSVGGVWYSGSQAPPSPSAGTGTPGAVWAYQQPNAANAWFRAPWGKGFSSIRYTLSLQADEGVTNQQVQVDFNGFSHPTIGTGTVGDTSSVTITGLTNMVRTSYSFVLTYPNDTEPRSVHFQLSNFSPTNKVWVVGFKGESIP